MAETLALFVIVPYDLRDDMVDALIGLQCISGFNVDTISGYSREHSRFNLREQVEGSRKLCRFEIVHAAEDQQTLLTALQALCAPVNAHYWTTPVLSQGNF